MDISIGVVTGQGTRVDLDAHELTGGERREATRTETAQWIKRLRLVDYDGRTMRERFTYRDDSLWWFTEIYLQKTRRLEHAVATILALDAVVAEHGPARIEVTAKDPAARAAAEAFGRARRVAVTVAGAPTPASGVRWASHLVGWSARLSRLRPRAHLEGPAGRVLRPDARDAAAVHAQPHHAMALARVRGQRPCALEQDAIEDLAGHREGVVPIATPGARGRIAALQPGAVGRHDAHAPEGARARFVHVLEGAQAIQDASRLRREILAADLRPGKGRLVEEQHRPAPLGEENGSGAPGRTRAHHHHVMGGHGASPRPPTRQ